MTRNFSRLAGIVALALALTVAGLTSGTSALASTVGPTKVGPHQWFAGQVNGDLQNAVVKVVCPPLGTVGRALPGQTVSVTWLPVIASDFGYTGSKGRAIAVNIGPSATAAPTILFTTYNSPAAFPTDVPVPCGGTGIVVFDPVPGSHGAKPGTVTVAYANIATGASG
jgi:hypothetical protein